MSNLLNDAEIEDQLTGLPGWTRTDDEIRAEFTGADFVAAMAFVNAVATLAQSADHHPDIDIRYNRVVLALSTHSDGGLTAKDFALAKQIDVAAAGVARIDR